MLIAKKKEMLILGEGITQGLDGATLTAEKCVQLILPKIIKKIV